MAKNELTLEELATRIYAGVGGMGNVESIVHCMTRVRMKIINDELVDVAKLKAIPGVLGVVEDEQLQVIIGPGKVNKVAQTMVDQAGVKLGEQISSGNRASDKSSASGKDLVNERAQAMKAAQKNKQKPSKIKSILKDISNIFVPMIPAFVGTGIVAGIAAVLANLVTAGTLDAATWQQYIDIMNILKNGMFSFLVIYTGINAAQGGILGVIFAVWLLAIVEKKLHKVVPDSIDIIVTPTLSLIAIGLVEIFFIMPLAGFISDGMVGGINWVLGVGGAFSGFVLGTLFLPMVMFGLHQILTPIHVQMIDETGKTLLLPILAMAGAGQVGAALALWVRCKKDKELTEMIKGALPVGILGIGEPLIYGMTLPLGRPFITACIGGGIGGAVVGMIGNVGAIAIGPSGAALIPLISDGKWLGYVLGLLAAYAGGFLATFFFGIPKEQLEKEELAEETTTEMTPMTENTGAVSTSEISLAAVADGVVESLEKASDPVFAQKMMGEGYFVEPINGQIYSPVSGTISSVFPTKHAIGITTANGLEVLLHMGINTVDLGGTPFEVKVTEGQLVTPDTLVAQVDLAAIKAAGKETSMMVLITNMEKVKNFVLEKTGETKAKAKVMTVEATKN